MSERLDVAALEAAGELLQRLTQLVEDGTFMASAEAQLIAAAWLGAADALSAAARLPWPP